MAEFPPTFAPAVRGGTGAVPSYQCVGRHGGRPSSRFVERDHLLRLVQSPIVILKADLRLGGDRSRTALVDERDGAAVRLEVVLVPIEDFRKLSGFRGGIVFHTVLGVHVTLGQFFELLFEFWTAESFAIKRRATAAGAVQGGVHPRLARVSYDIIPERLSTCLF